MELERKPIDTHPTERGSQVDREFQETMLESGVDG